MDRIARELNVRPQQVAATADLLDAGNTLPFIARYRKEATGGLDEEQLRKVIDRIGQLRALEQRRAAIEASVEEQGKLSDALRKRLHEAETLTALEDLYAPYRPKRRSRATVARERGLEPLARQIIEQPPNSRPAEAARRYLGDEVADSDAALAGARDIVAEIIADHPDVRGRLRDKALRFASIECARAPRSEDERQVFRDYYSFNAGVSRLRPHQILAMDRGEAEKVLRVKIVVPERDWRDAIAADFRPDTRSPWSEQLRLAVEDAADRLLLPAIERDVRRALTEHAQAHAIAVFGENLRALLGQPPLGGQVVLGVDPGFRTGCKVAVVDPTGKVLDTATMYPHPPQNRREDALQTLAGLLRRHHGTLLAIGNGTASRETESLVAALLADFPKVHYLMVNEAGASVYSASPLARAELPDLDVSMRGAVSIARRVQDPLAELVKIDPQSIGVGLYQHDLEQGNLKKALDGVVESVVNRVGVEVNTASPALLTHVAGVGPKLAEKIVAHRNKNGPFNSRQTLLGVAGLGPKAFEQAAGFLRVRGGKEPLDNTAIHPESYAVAREVMKRPTGQRAEDLAAVLGCGVPTLRDILEQLARPGRDPREDVPGPLLRRDVLSASDLRVGMQLRGTVRNVVDFGAFVDIGVKQDGLVHRTRIPHGQSLSVGEVIEVEIVAVEVDRGRISLSIPVDPV
ncbi:MAG: RNA-binding transcriptional accessory protein [Armatimonadetes bacterium]|nr:RNA-binding transcriptional accessory protein [Armatimonadota bacterium]